MPNIRRTAPGSGNQDSYNPYQAGKQLRVGGKGFHPARESEESESEESEEEERPQFRANSGGKQLRAPGGKYLRPPPQDDDDEEESEEESSSEEEEEEAPQPVRVVQRSGGKNLQRMPQPESEEESSSSEEEQEEEEAPASAPQPYRVTQRGGGKSLARMQPPTQGEESESEESSSEEEEEEKAPIRPVQRSGGKGLYHSGGKQLQRPEEAVKVTTAPTTSIIGGKSFRPLEEVKKEELPKIAAAPRGGKQLRRADSNEESPSVPEGKQLQKPEEEAKKPASKKAIVPSPGRGKQLRRPAKEEEEEEEEELEFDSDAEEEEAEEPEDDDDDDYEEAVLPKAKARPRRGAATKARKVVPEVEEEIVGDDEISSDEDDIELDINNTEALIRDEEDRRHLDSLPELEREAILGERFEKLKAEQDMKKAIREAKRKESEKAAAKGKLAKNRKAELAKKPLKKSKTDPDEELARSLASRRESARDRDKKGTKSKKAAALAALKKERKIQQQQQREDSSEESEIDFGDDDDDSDEDYDEEVGLKPWQQKKTRGKSTVSRLDQDDDSAEDMDIDDDDDDDDQVNKRDSRSGTAKTSAGDADAGLEDFLKVTVPRRRLARWCNEPFFKDAVHDCFVRLFIGEDDSGVKVYRLCEIIGVNTSNKSYKFPIAKKGDKPVSTNKTLRLKFGTSERDFPMYLVSDAPPEEIDVQKYIATQKDRRLDTLSKRRANKLRRLQDDLVNNYTYTTEDIERNLELRKRQGKSAGNLGLEQTKVAIALQAARENVSDMERRVANAKRALMESDNSAEEDELTKTVKEAEKRLEIAKLQLEKRLDEAETTKEAVQDRKRKLTQRSKDRHWAKVNQRNVQANQRADREANKANDDSAVAGTGKKKEFNPYARRRVKPKILWEVGQAKDEEEAQKAEEKKDSAKDTANEVKPTSSVDVTAPKLVHESHGKAPALHDRHQFAIDEEGLAQSTAIDSMLGGMRRKAPTKHRARKGISLADYFDRKENGTL